MIKFICGEKGTGKTKIILDSVNESAKTAKGNVVFITEKKGYSVNIDFNVRCIYTEDFCVKGESGFIGFIDGLMAGNADIEYIYVDGILRITGCTVDELDSFFAEIKQLEKQYGVKFILTVSCARESIPEKYQEYCA